MFRKLLIGGSHLIFWLVFSYFSLALGFNIYQGWDFLFTHLHVFIIHLAWAFLVFYLFYYHFAPIYIQQKKLVSYLIISIIISVILTILFSQIIFRTNTDLVYLENIFLYIGGSFGTFIIAQCGALLRGFVNWYDELERKSELEKRNLQMELDLLKSQLNPHFLFNTLNNIDAMIHTSPDKASESVILLSGILRHMIYETNHDFVPLQNEMNYLNQYVSLQKLRFRSPNHIVIDSNITNNKLKIAPMLFLVFVENAFKHGIGKDEMPSIEIKLYDKQDKIYFFCKNYCNSYEETCKPEGGLGLSNIKKRLELIYPNRHSLNINHTSGIFTVNLIIDAHDY